MIKVMFYPRHRILTVVGLVASMLAAGCSDPSLPEAGARASAQPQRAHHVGRAVCAECHRNEAKLWEGSHHDLAMQLPTEETVLGDFNGTEFVYAGVTTTFFRRDGKFMVRTDDSDGRLRDFEIAYTFGADPLQQYLIELPGGRIQALSVCWDARATSQGGQRWFHLYPDENVDHDDELHWTGRNQNWNFMCAECHSTRVRKGYVATDNRFETTWTEIDVSCEACHGPGSLHVAWAGQEHHPTDPLKGLTVQLADTDGGYWIPDLVTGLAARSVPRSSHAVVETCARCHSRRSAFSDDYVHGQPLMDTHRPALLDEGLYHADGQILDEVYVHGSFLQSRMHAEGVTCSDCHDPHSLELRASGNAVCATCHLPARFDVGSHHFHEEGLPGSACIDCHMPSRNYMVVDPRHDHSFRIPRPDLSVKLGTPNACSACHTDRSTEWAATAVTKWYGSERSPHYAEALYAARNNLPGAEQALQRVADDPETTGIVRATAASMLGRFPSPESAKVLQRAVASDDPLVRFGAVRATESLPPAPRVSVAFPLLADPVRTVRMEAARVLASLSPGDLTPEQRSRRERVLGEYRRAQQFNADRVESHLNLGLLHIQLGRPQEAEREYRKALEMVPDYVPGYVNLSDLYRAQGRDDEGEQILREGLAAAPDNAEIHHALGLLLVRQKRGEVALSLLERAATLRPDEARYGYVFGVALQSAGEHDRAIVVLQGVHERHPGERDTLLALATISRDGGALDAAAVYAQKLLELAPQDPGIRQLAAQIEAERR